MEFEAYMEFPDVYKVRRSLWQVAGRWGELQSLPYAELLYFLPLDKGQKVKPRERSGCEHRLHTCIFLYQHHRGIAKQHMVRKPQGKQSITVGISWAPCNKIIWVCCGKGLRWLLYCLRRVDCVLFLLFPRTETGDPVVVLLHVT